MPRYENMDPADSTSISDYCARTGNGSSTFDLCRRCGPRVAGRGVIAVGLRPYNGDPAGVLSGPDVEHPTYDDDPDMYHCDLCGEGLTSRDD